MKVLKVLIKSFEAPQKKCENKNSNFYFNATFSNVPSETGKKVF